MTRRAVLLALLAAGCGRAPPPPTAAATGAREAAREFFGAVVRRDWPGAYSWLDSESVRGVSAADFARRGEAYRKHLGFDPAGVHVRTCEEHGDGATARVELTGPGTGRHHYKDAVVLRRQGGRWRVVLSQRFGAG